VVQVQQSGAAVRAMLGFVYTGQADGAALAADLGGALDLAAACDIRVCTSDAFFTVQEIHIGMAADLGVLQRLPKIVPAGVAREMAYSGDRLGAERALAAGLVNEVLPDAAALHAHAEALAKRIAAKSPLAVAGSKRALNFARDHGTAQALEQMTLLQSAIFDIDEMTAAIAAWTSARRRSSRSRPSRTLESGKAPQAAFNAVNSGSCRLRGR
jgi:enoyl-CoA hydratase/carnithine racemase